MPSRPVPSAFKFYEPIPQFPPFHESTDQKFKLPRIKDGSSYIVHRKVAHYTCS